MRATDQAASLRLIQGTGHVPSPRRERAIAVTGGKGGVGKSTIAVGLASAFVADGSDTLMIDADLGMADLNLLLQTWHGQPTNGTLHAMGGAANSPSLGALRRVASLEAPEQDAARATAVLAKNGYRYLAIYRQHFPAGGIDAISDDIGPPLASDDRVVLWRITRASLRP